MEDGTVRIKQESINQVKAAIIGKKTTIGKFYAEAAKEKLNKWKENTLLTNAKMFRK